MTRLRGSLPAAAVALFLLSACAATGASPVDVGQSSPADDTLVLQVKQVGGFVATTTNVTRLPIVSVYADGRVLTEGPQIAIYPGPALPNLQVQRIDPSAVDALVDKAVAAGVKTGADMGQPGVADIPSTRFTVVTDSGTQTLDVVALRETSAELPGLTAEQRAARAKLIVFLDDLTNLPAPTASAPAASAPVEPSGAYQPQVLAAVARPYAAPADLPGSAAPAVPWPGPALPGDTLGEGTELGCVAVSGAELAPVLAAAAKANAATAWSSAGKQWSLTFRPLLPGENGCADLKAA
jgi:hypothetical protein